MIQTVPVFNFEQQPFSRMQRQANIAATAPSGGAIK
jgi:hypothetical protein